MNLTEKQKEKLEDRITDILKKGYRRMDSGDCVAASHEISEMLSNEYAMENRNDLLEEMGFAGSLGEAVKDMQRLLREPNNGFLPLFKASLRPLRAAGFGGGMGDPQ